jgi:pimeloyl-ACP methyl ester carboxylesterase
MLESFRMHASAAELTDLRARLRATRAAIPIEQHARRVEVPSGFALFPGDTLHPPRRRLERFANVVRVAKLPRGGHFAPFEEPELYARELRDFFRPYRTAVAADQRPAP